MGQAEQRMIVRLLSMVTAQAAMIEHLFVMRFSDAAVSAEAAAAELSKVKIRVPDSTRASSADLRLLAEMRDKIELANREIAVMAADILKLLAARRERH